MGKGKKQEAAAALGQGWAEGSFSLPAASPAFLPTSAPTHNISESSGRSLGGLEEYPKPC